MQEYQSYQQRGSPVSSHQFCSNLCFNTPPFSFPPFHISLDYRYILEVWSVSMPEPFSSLKALAKHCKYGANIAFQTKLYFILECKTIYEDTSLSKPILPAKENFCCQYNNIFANGFCQNSWTGQCSHLFTFLTSTAVLTEACCIEKQPHSQFQKVCQPAEFCRSLFWIGLFAKLAYWDPKQQRKTYKHTSNTKFVLSRKIILWFCILIDHNHIRAVEGVIF